MPKKQVPRSKMNKKQRRAEYAKYRRSWNGLSPVTRVTPNGKAYRRSRARQQERREIRDEG